MAKTVLIKYNKASLYRCGDFRIIVGLNEVREEIWEAVKDNPGIKKRIESGEIALVNASSKDKPKPERVERTAVGEIISDPDELIDESYVLEEMNVKEAQKLIKQTYNYKTLVDWKKKETRKVLLAAINKQLAEFSEAEDDTNAT